MLSFYPGYHALTGFETSMNHCHISWKKGLTYVAMSGLGLAGLLTISALTPRKWVFPANYACEVTIYLSNDPLHTNIFVPVETSVFNWRTQLNLDAVAPRPGRDYRYLQFGWGEHIFYTSSNLAGAEKVFRAARALFYWRNDSAIFVKGHANLGVFTDDFKCLQLSREDYLALSEFLQNTFALNAQGQEQRIADGADHQSGFYEARGRYSILNTCNTWTANGLRAANVNTPLWSGLAQPVMFHARNACQCRVLPGS